MSAPFFTATATNWIAIGSIAGSLLTLLVSNFNFSWMRASRRQARASTEQAAIALLAAQLAKERAESAKHSLDEMMHWAEVARNLRKETAIEALEVLARSARNWIPSLLEDTIDSPITIMPRAFDEVMAFLMLQIPDLQDEIRLFQSKVQGTESTLAAFIEKPVSARSIAQRTAVSLGNRLEQVAVAAESLSGRIQIMGFKSLEEVAEWPGLRF
jgi:hypothetical protein